MQDDIARSGSNVHEADRSGRKDLRHHRRDVHPAFVASRFGKESGGPPPIRLAGCAAVCDLARGESENPRVPRSSPEVADLKVVTSSRAGRAPPAPQAEDDNAAKRLWRESASSPASNEGDAGMRRGTVQVARRDHGRS